jgi:hypothetical protein
MERSAQMPGATLSIPLLGDRQSVWIGLDHCIEERIPIGNSIQVIKSQMLAGERSGIKEGLKLRNGRLDPVFSTVRCPCYQRSRNERGEPSGQDRGATCEGHSDECPATYAVIV